MRGFKGTLPSVEKLTGELVLYFPPPGATLHCSEGFDTFLNRALLRFGGTPALGRLAESA